RRFVGAASAAAGVDGLSQSGSSTGPEAFASDSPGRTVGVAGAESSSGAGETLIVFPASSCRAAAGPYSWALTPDTASSIRERTSGWFMFGANDTTANGLR